MNCTPRTTNLTLAVRFRVTDTLAVPYSQFMNLDTEITSRSRVARIVRALQSSRAVELVDAAMIPCALELAKVRRALGCDIEMRTSTNAYGDTLRTITRKAVR